MNISHVVYICFLLCTSFYSCLCFSQSYTTDLNHIVSKSSLEEQIDSLIAKYNDYIDINHRDHALEVLVEAEKIASENLANNDPVLSNIYAHYADYYGNIGDRIVALEYAERCIAIRRQHFSEDDPDYIEALYNMARFTERIGQYVESNKYLDTIISTSAAGDSILLARSYHLFSLLLIRQNDFESAKKYALIALRQFNDLIGPNSNYSSYAHQELATANFGLGDYANAMLHYNKAYRIRKEIHGKYNRLTLSTNTSITRTLIAQGDTVKALQKYKEIAEDYLVEYDIAKSDKHVLSLIEIGEYYAQLSQKDSAEHYYLRALRIAERYYKTGDRPFVQANHNLSSTVPLLERTAYSKQALFHLTGSTTFHELDESKLPFMNDRYSILRVYVRHAKNLFALYETSRDDAYLKELLSLEKEYRLLNEEVFRHFLSPKSIVSSAYRIRQVCLLRLRASYILFEITHSEKYLDTALRAMEESKNLVLQAQLFSKNLPNIIGIPDSVTQREKFLFLNINKLKNQQKKNNSKQLESQLIELEAEYLDSRRRSLMGSEKYRKIINPLNVSISDILNNMDNSSILLNYFLDRGELFILYVSKTKSGIIKSSFTEDDQAQLNSYIQFIQTITADNSIHSWNLGHYFYKKLIPPKLGPQIKKITIIPDNNLFVVPFDVLLTHVPDTELSYNQYPFLIKQFEISHLSGIHYNQFNTSYERLESVLALAPFSSLDDSETNDYPVLVHSKSEIESIHDSFQKELIEGSQATETTFKEKINHHDIVHIASHAVIDEQMPINSNIIFYPNKHLLEKEDGELAIWELYTMNINSSLAILSACQTSTGNTTKGDGLTNIARGFYAAGINTVISNLWPVQDYAASKIMKGFYLSLSANQSPSTAMRKAKLNYLNHQIGPLAHPRYWAGWMVQQSEISTTINSPPSSFLIFFIGSLICFGALFIFFKMRTR